MVKSVAGLCMTVVDSQNGYQPVVKMTECAADGNDNGKWRQQFSFNRDDCGARPIRYTKDPSKCVDAVHPQKILLTDCSGVDSQKFEMRCSDGSCYLLAMGGRKDMCVWWNAGEHNEHDLRLRRCNFHAAGGTKRITTEARFIAVDQKRETGVSAPTVPVPATV